MADAEDHRRAFRLAVDGPLWAWLEGLPPRQVPAGEAARDTGVPFTAVPPGGVLLHLPGPVGDAALVARCHGLARVCGGGTRFCPTTGVLRAGGSFRPIPGQVWFVYVR